MKEFVDDLGLGGFDHIADRAGSIWRAFQVSAQPSFVFINDNGEIRRHIGSLEVEDLNEQLDLLLAS